MFTVIKTCISACSTAKATGCQEQGWARCRAGVSQGTVPLAPWRGTACPAGSQVPLCEPGINHFRAQNPRQGKLRLWFHSGEFWLKVFPFSSHPS